MKIALITTTFLMVGSNAYDRVGIERYCNVDPSEFTAQCNFESLESCNAYLMPGQRCMANPAYVTSGIKDPTKQVVSDRESIPLQLLEAWKRDKSLSSTWAGKAKKLCDLLSWQINRLFWDVFSSLSRLSLRLTRPDGWTYPSSNTKDTRQTPR